MKVKTTIGCTLLLAGEVIFGQANAMEYIPYKGVEGYQEIEISSDTYYVAFQGSKKTSRKLVKKGWEVRSAQLCQAQGAASFIKLNYSFEPVIKGDQPVIEHQSFNKGSYINVGGTVYIPIFTPSYGEAPLITAPSYLSHIKCIKNKDDVVDSARLIDISPIIEDAITLGWIDIIK